MGCASGGRRVPASQEARRSCTCGLRRCPPPPGNLHSPACFRPPRPSTEPGRVCTSGHVPSAPACPPLWVGAVWSLTRPLPAGCRAQTPGLCLLRHTEWAQGAFSGGQTWSRVTPMRVTGEPCCVQDAVCSLTSNFSSGACPSFGAAPPGLVITLCRSRWTGVLPPSPFQLHSSKA